MAPMLSSQIISEIDAYIQKEGSGYRWWYVGITNDPRERLFTIHNVSEKKKSWWIYKEAQSVEDARQIEDFLISQRGADGNPGAGDITSRFVYAYKETESTNP